MRKNAWNESLQQNMTAFPENVCLQIGLWVDVHDQFFIDDHKYIGILRITGYSLAKLVNIKAVVA